VTETSPRERDERRVEEGGRDGDPLADCERVPVGAMCLAYKGARVCSEEGRAGAAHDPIGPGNHVTGRTRLLLDSGANRAPAGPANRAARDRG
jgi:hypothetical protein